MVKPVKREPKKPYSSPIITMYGTVQELTQHVPGSKGHDQWTRHEESYWLLKNFVRSGRIPLIHTRVFSLW